MEALTATSVWTLLGAIGGGAVVKMIDARVRMRTKRLDLETSFRTDLYTECKDLKAQLAAATKDCDDWRKAYYSAREEIAGLNGELLVLKARLRRTEESDQHHQQHRKRDLD